MNAKAVCERKAERETQALGADHQDALMTFLTGKGYEVRVNGSLSPELRTHLGIGPGCASVEDTVQLVVTTYLGNPRTSRGLSAELNCFYSEHGCRIRQGMGYMTVACKTGSYEVNILPLTAYNGRMPFMVLARPLERCRTN